MTFSVSSAMVIGHQEFEISPLKTTARVLISDFQIPNKYSLSRVEFTYPLCNHRDFTSVTRAF